MVEHIAARQDVREFRGALDELFALLLDNDDPYTPEWDRARLHRLTTHVQKATATLRRGGLRVDYLGFGSVEISVDLGPPPNGPR
ncbi:hypothetical protein MPY17_16470 [Rhodococcus opacus]|uniref:hypothetical protein n=1 Tax=Rhodococcus opacus TaxID=37919 RepID=UPI001FF63D87|nr:MULTISPECIES: hypothetical protein [Rhodococcus]UOT07218.1 hypothetical protein MPY17_16470 [Rhodococcus opacus]GLK34537.1 hypothetical protein GCM10017611_13850 [Rhodococcus wratislaviensis]